MITARYSNLAKLKHSPYNLKPYNLRHHFLNHCTKAASAHNVVSAPPVSPHP